MTKWRQISMALYATIAVVTFGHGAADRYEKSETTYFECRTAPKAFCLRQSTSDAVFAGVFAAAVWPLYWSWTVFDESE